MVPCTSRVAPEKTVFRPVLACAFQAGLPPEKHVSTYAQRLLDPRWQRRRLEILNRSDFACESCGAKDKTLHVHHKLYRKKAMPWEYGDDELTALCSDCHEQTEHWRTLLTEAIAKLDSGTLEMVVGFVEGTVAHCDVSSNYDVVKDRKWPVRSYEHAVGLALALDGWQGGHHSNHVDCLCDVRHFDSRDVDALGEGYTIRAPDDDR